MGKGGFPGVETPAPSYDHVVTKKDVAAVKEKGVAAVKLEKAFANSMKLEKGFNVFILVSPN